MHGLPALHDPPEAIHVLASGRAETVSPGVIAHRRTEGPPGDVCERCGLRVTSVARTVADLAAATSFVGGVVLADAALSTGPFGERAALATRPLIHAAAESIPDPVGRRRALAVVGFADGRAESVLESVSRATMALAGAPPPRLQVPLRDDAGFRARVDFLWPERGLAGEADGAAKTVHPAMLRGRSPAEAVARLDARRRAIEALGVRVMSWRWETGRRVERMRALLHAHGIPLASGPAIEGL
ncbi:hypothetical protein [uncultured Leifsonia sp.]|uniref:hypothetical protein n=1 Tax=uncultured Leifsonia sp. TaxID=340359 RepID=UPI0028D440A8|nr:hypothetical protein [uncultured Leifsonia sp.]